MAFITLENVPEDMYRVLESLAAFHTQSVAEETIALLQRTLSSCQGTLNSRRQAMEELEKCRNQRPPHIPSSIDFKREEQMFDDLPREVYQRLQEQACAHHRSTADEAIALLQQALMERVPERHSDLPIIVSPA